MERIIDKVVDLKYPIKEGEKEIRRLEFVRPKVKHLQNMDLSKLSETKNILKLTQALTAVDEKALRELDVSDLVKVAETVTGFLEESPQPTADGMS